MIATRESYGKALVELGEENENIVVLDADLSSATKTKEFSSSLNFHLYSHNLSLGQKEYVYLSEMKINHEIIYEFELIETNLNQFGFTPKQYKLVFSDENIKDFEVTINDEIIDVDDNIIEAKQGLYKVKITYTKNNNLYEATYRLNIK